MEVALPQNELFPLVCEGERGCTQHPILKVQQLTGGRVYEPNDSRLRSGSDGRGEDEDCGMTVGGDVEF